MKSLSLILLGLSCASSFALGADAPPAAAEAAVSLAAPAKEIALYPGIAPGSEHWNWEERAAGSPRNPTVENVVHPVLLYYPADKARAVGTAVIVAPGGGFHNLMMSYEGVTVAQRLNEMGVDAFVLKYRLRYTDPRAPAPNPAPAGSAPAPGTGRPAGVPATGPQAGQNIRELAGLDGQQAIRLVRQDAAAYGVRPDRIGIMGFSAGGAVVVRAAKSTGEGRPDFAIAIYAADANGEAPPAGAPPLFIAVAADDQSVGYLGSLNMFAAWRKANIPVELHIFQTGRHGFPVKGGGADHYLDRLQEWLKLNGYLTK